MSSDCIKTDNLKYCINKLECRHVINVRLQIIFWETHSLKHHLL